MIKNTANIVPAMSLVYPLALARLRLVKTHMVHAATKTMTHRACKLLVSWLGLACQILRDETMNSTVKTMAKTEYNTARLRYFVIIIAA